MPVPVAEQRKLYQLSGNICAFPGCSRELTAAATTQDPLVVVSEVAHIVAESEAGPRGDATLPVAERNKYENLILLCNQHHQLIDSQPNTWTVTRLKDIKRAHEQRVRRALGTIDVVTGRPSGDVLPNRLLDGLSTVGSITNPALLRIHPAIPLVEPAPDLDRALPAYIQRDVDIAVREELAAMLNSGGFVLLVGRAVSGKTRLAYEAVRAVMPDWRLLLPANADDVHGIARADLGRGQIVLWLDDIERFLQPGQLSSGTLQRLIEDPSRPVVVVGTIWPDRYDQLMHQGGSDDARMHLYQQARDALRLAHRFDVAADFSEAELKRTQQVARLDPRVREAATHSHIGSPVSILACAAELVAKRRQAADPAGAAILNAAVDIRLCGHQSVIPSALLENLAASYLPAALRASATTDWFSHAADWAITPVRGTASALIPHATIIGQVDGYEVSDILLHDAVRDPDFSPRRIPVSTWEKLADEADTRSSEVIGLNAVELGLTTIGRQSLLRALGRGSKIALAVLGLSYFDEGDLTTAIEWFRQALDAGLDDFAAMIAVCYHKLGDRAQELRWLHAAAESGHPGAMVGLGSTTEDEGNLQSAADWYNQALDRGFVPAMSYLGALEHRRGNIEAGTAWFQRGAEAGEPDAMMNLATILYDHGDLAGAERWLRAAMQNGKITAATRLAQLLRETQRPDEALPLALRAAESGDETVFTVLGLLLADHGHGDEAEKWLRRGVQAGQTDSMLALGDILEERSDIDGARSLFVKAATDFPTPLAALRYGMFLREFDDPEEAQIWIERAAEADDPDVQGLLAQLAAKAEDENSTTGETPNEAGPTAERHAHYLGSGPLPAVIEWTPLQQRCGCVIDWGWSPETGDPGSFLQICFNMPAFNCPWHGAASGASIDAPDDATIAMNDPTTSRTQYVRRTRGKENIELGKSLAAGIREIASAIADGDEERMLAGAPRELVSWYADNGYDPVSTWIESRLTDLILNRIV